MPSPPRPKKRRRGIFWKLFGLSIATAGGVVGYAWYDNKFKKTVEENVPYSKEVFSYIFEYLPEYLPYLTSRPAPSVIQEKPKDGAAVKQEKAAVPTKSTPQVPATPVKPPETAKERAAREAREKKEQAQELLRKREAEEAAQNLALETGLGTLLASVDKSIETAVSAQRSAAKAVTAHTDMLKKAMDADGTEDQWQSLIELQQARADAVWASERVTHDAQEALDKLRQAIASGRENQTTKRNKILSRADKELNKFSYELSTATAELTKARSQSTVLTSYRDLVMKGQDQFSKELEQIVPGVKIGEKSGQLSTPELNSLIGHAHRRVDQLQRQLVEQTAMEPLRMEAALDNEFAKEEQLVDEKIAEERQRFAADITKLHDAWEKEAKAEFEAELRQQLARQAAAHSDHLVSVLHAQRVKLEAEFEKQLVAGVQTAKDKMIDNISALVNRVNAVESAVSGRAERQRSGQLARELWVACRTLLSVIKDGQSVNAAKDKPTPINAELNAVRDAGSEYTIVHVALSTVSSLAFDRGVYTPDALRHRFDGVRRVARRVAMIDDSNASMARYILSYIQSFFVLRSSVVSDTDDVSEMSVFALLDNAANCLKYGDIEQAVRYVNQLRGEPRRIALEWLNEARLLLETRQAAELILAFASANGLGALE